jgi:hypothetical protein
VENEEGGVAETIYNLEQDLKEAQAMADALVPYVYEDNLYGSIGGMFNSGKMPSLTLGALLMRLRRLHALESQMSDEQRARLNEVDRLNESVRKEWSVHYNEKLVQEANSRLKAMRQYFEECRDDPRLCANSYLPEALRRTIVQEIADALDRHDIPSNELDRAMGSADSSLRRYVRPSEFIWAKELEPVYPQATFWWLYSKPPQPERVNKG